MAKAYIILWDNGLSAEEHYVVTHGVTLSEDVAKREVARLTEEYAAGRERHTLLREKTDAHTATHEDYQELWGPLSVHDEDQYREDDEYLYEEYDLIE